MAASYPRLKLEDSGLRTRNHKEFCDEKCKTLTDNEIKVSMKNAQPKYHPESFTPKYRDPCYDIIAQPPILQKKKNNIESRSSTSMGENKVKKYKSGKSLKIRR